LVIVSWLLMIPGSLLFLAFPGKAIAADDEIVAIVNDEIITRKELGEYLHAMYLQLLTEGKETQEIHELMTEYEIHGLEQLIDDKLVLDEANKQGLEIRPKAIEERLEKIKQKYKNEQEFLDALSEQGLTVTDLKNKILDQYKIKYIVEFEVRGKIYVNPQEVTDYYQIHFDEFREPEKVDLDCVFVFYGKEPEEARQKALQALKDLQEGKAFEHVVKEYSEGSAMGMVHRGQLLPSVEDVVFGLKEGETSSLVETQDGIYIFKVKEKIPARVTTLEEAKAGIYNTIFEKKFQEKLRFWLEGLRKKAYVEIKT